MTSEVRIRRRLRFQGGGAKPRGTSIPAGGRTPGKKRIKKFNRHWRDMVA